MKKIFVSVILLIPLLFISQTATATSGACSYHGGVDCAAGPGIYGNVTCNDGWTGSTVSYDSMIECQGYNTSPTCPSMSYYDSISRSCTCVSGYVAQRGSCVSADSVCQQQIGFMSNYNSLTDTCQCMSGYFLKNGQCTYGNTVCHNELGYNSSYNSFSKRCECYVGYSIDSSGQCVSDTVYSYPVTAPYTPIYTPSCSDNSSLVNGQCSCNVGYMLGSDKTSCISYNQNCQSKYGANSYGDKNYCYCSPGFQFNSGKTYCQTAAVSPSTINNNNNTTASDVKGATTYNFNRNLKLGMRGDDVQALQSLLSDKGFLNLKKNTKIGYFGSTTKAALIKYQKSLGLKATGILNADTIYAISH